MPIRFAPAVMSVFGLALAWRSMVHLSGWPIALSGVVSMGLAVLGLVIFALIVFHVIRPGAFLEAIAHPHTRIMPAGLTIGLMLLAALISPEFPVLGTTLIWIASLAHMGYLMWLLNGWLKGDGALEQVSPGWFIPAVGNIVIPVGAMAHGQMALAWVGFSIGVMLWLALLPIVLYRLIIAKPMPPELEASQMILVAPPAIGSVSWSLLMPQTPVPGLMLAIFAGFLWLALLPLVRRVLARPFVPANWAFGFPMAALVSALMRTGDALAQPLMMWAAVVVLVCVTALVTWCVIGSIRSLVKS